MRGLLAVVAACLVCGVLAGPAGAVVSKDGWGFAIADDSSLGSQPTALGPRFARLAPKTFRLQMHWNASAGDKQNYHGLIDRARAAGVQQVVVSFKKNGAAPSPVAYNNSTTALIKEFAPKVDVWGPANEPNRGDTWLPNVAGAQKLAQYWQYFKFSVSVWDPGAKMTSPDFADRRDRGSIATYVNAYANAGGGFGDYIAYHAYWAAYHQDIAPVNTFINFARSLPTGQNKPVWITEVGGFGINNGSKEEPINEPQNQTARVDWIVNTLANAAHIQRIYHYHMFSDNPAWDTALLDSAGNPRWAWYFWCWASHNNINHPDCKDTPSGSSSGIRPGDNVVSWASDRIDLFVRGTGSDLRHKWWNATTGWEGWEAMGGVLGSEPSAISLHPGHLDVFVRGSDSGLHHRWFDNGNWSGWEQLGGSISGRPSVVAWNSGRLDIFARGTDGSLQHKAWDAGAGWHPWESLGGNLTSDPSAVSLYSGHLDVFVRGTDNGLHHRWFTPGSGWSGWISQGGSIAGRPTVVTRGTGAMEVFARGTDNSLAHIGWDANYGWFSWESMGGPIEGDPGAVSQHPTHASVYVRGTDTAIHQRWWDASVGWSGWIGHGGSGFASTPSVISLRLGHEDVYASGTTGLWWHRWQDSGPWQPWSLL